jgi:3-hydroxy-9,10-secoandrosta-1,3,5(10)-triene-9,17-dione monooxygenase reductase component
MDPQAYRDAIGHFATGVCVVTCEGPAGLTTNAVTSLSLDPLLLLVCFDGASRTLPLVRQSGRFAVNVLAKGQDELARIFASKRVHAEKFAAVSHDTAANGVPVLDGTLAWIACDVRELLPGGDHTIGIGAVTDAWADPEPREPLVFFNGAYR